MVAKKLSSIGKALHWVKYTTAFSKCKTADHMRQQLLLPETTLSVCVMARPVL